MYKFNAEDINTVNPKLSFQGRLENSKEIKKEIYQIINSVDDKVKLVIIDLNGVELISEECFVMFNELASNMTIRFIGYTLFLEEQLNNHNLLENDQKEHLNTKLKMEGF